MRPPSRPYAATFAAIAPLLAACSGAPAGPGEPGDPAGSETVGTTAQAITGSEVLARGDEWVQAQVPYCQAANHQPDYDTSCASTCTRPDNAAWDPYRSDCSGFVSWAWGLPAPGRTTAEFAPADTTVSTVINGADLQPGDALNIPSDHIVLFVSWQTVGSVANFYEEPGCSAAQPYAHAFTSNVTINGSSVDIAYEGKTFTAIRFTGLTAGDGGAPPGSGTGSGDVVPDAGGSTCSLPNGDQGECLDTSVCTALGGSYMPTAGYCPGAANIQCCTGMPGSNAGDGGGAGSTDAGVVTEPSSDGSTAPQPPPKGGGTTGSGTASGAGSSGAGSTPGGASSGTGTSESTDGGAIPQSSNGFSPTGSSGGCSVGASRARGVDGAWMFGLAAIGIARASRRRRGVASAR